MRLSRTAFISVLLVSFSFLVSLPGHSASVPRAIREASLEAAARASCPSLITDYHRLTTTAREPAESAGEGQGIHENMPEKFAVRYQQWKKEFLSTETGLQQWTQYENRPNFSLTIVVSRDNPEGATTGEYKWNDAGELVAATITLGNRLDLGFPNPVYFPVMNSLVPTETSNRIEGGTLAATKMAHEFGHVNRTMKVGPAVYQLQTELITQYNAIFMSNGRNPNDPRLLEIVKKMGGTPVEIWEDREYWGETNAMLYLRDRFADSFRCVLFNRIRRSVDLYAKGYAERFLSIAQSTSSGNHCGWQ